MKEFYEKYSKLNSYTSQHFLKNPEFREPKISWCLKFLGQFN